VHTARASALAAVFGHRAAAKAAALELDAAVVCW